MSIYNPQGLDWYGSLCKGCEWSVDEANYLNDAIDVIVLLNGSLCLLLFC